MEKDMIGSNEGSEYSGRNVEQYKKMHEGSENYGTSSITYLSEIELIINFLHPHHILDYGCGKGALDEVLKNKYHDISIVGYDPAIPGKDVLPSEHFDLIINTDVLEHIPEDEIDEVLEKIRGLSSNCVFGLHHALAEAILPNGQNAHCTVRSIHWYFDKFSDYFPCVTILEGRHPWMHLVLTFPINTEVWDSYNRIIIKGKLLEFLYIFYNKYIPSLIKPFFFPIKLIVRRMIGE